MNKRFKIICFDMDGTLIRNTNSVEYLCNLNSKHKEVREIEIMEHNDEISWIEVDYLKANLFKGLAVTRIKESFEGYIETIDNLDYVINELKRNGFKVILVTAGPIQVAQELDRVYNFDQIYGSEYEVVDGEFTGKIKNHLGDYGKLKCLSTYCSENGILLEEVISVGDSASDIHVFENTGMAIAINYSKSVLGRAHEYLKTDDLNDILELITHV